MTVQAYTAEHCLTTGSIGPLWRAGKPRLENLAGLRTQAGKTMFGNPGNGNVSEPPPQTGSEQISQVGEIGYHDI